MKIQPYNKKAFLLPDSHRSMAIYHAKITDDEIMKLSIHDCKNGIKLWNDLTKPDEVDEAILKLTNLSEAINELKWFIISEYK